MAKKTMKGWEKSSMDAKADKGGKHGKEGSKRDVAADKRGLANWNKGKK